MERRVSERTAQLWLDPDCAILTEIWDKTLHGWLAGGKLGSIISLVPQIEETAAYWGLCDVTLHGRKGWDRVFAPLGYKREGEVLRKVLHVQ